MHINIIKTTKNIIICMRKTSPSKRKYPLHRRSVCTGRKLVFEKVTPSRESSGTPHYKLLTNPVKSVKITL